MRKLFLLISAFLLSSPLAFATAPDARAPLDAALSWLKTLDQGKAAESWKNTAQAFKEKVSQDQWQIAISGLRSKLGKLVSRDLLSENVVNSVPGAPKGKYDVIQFKCHYQKNAHVIETVTPMLEKDGTWRVSGYYAN